MISRIRQKMVTIKMKFRARHTLPLHELKRISCVLLISGLVWVANMQRVLSQTPTPTETPDPVFVGAGDIAQCNAHSEATAKLLDNIDGTVFTAGDNAYNEGTAEQFKKCYE